MASDPDDIFERLKKAGEPDSVKSREDSIRQRDLDDFSRAQKRLAELVQGNSTQPVHFESIRVVGAPNTRNEFLKKIINPALARSNEGGLTLREALTELQGTVSRLQHFEIFQPSITLHIDSPEVTNPDSLPLIASIAVKERGKYTLKSGTDLGNTEGSAYGTLIIRNLLGGAESINLTGSYGTRTRSAYHATVSAPIAASPYANWEVTALSTSRDNTAHASHVELQKGFSGTLRYFSPRTRWKQELEYEGVWRQTTSLHEEASMSVRHDAGDSVKSAITYTISHDTRFPNALLPSSGTLLRLRNSLAGLGPLSGTVAHLKSELASSISMPLPLGATWTTSARGGVLYPLAQGGGVSKPSSVADKFQLGGATDVRGFYTGGLGPQEGRDALGGDVYTAFSSSLIFPFPRASPDSGLRWHAFINGGRLLALPPSVAGRDGKAGGQGWEEVKSTLEEMKNQLPSMAAGVGIVYAHPIARFELNFCLPLIMRGKRGNEGSERAQKGFGFGVGIEFL